MKAATLTADLQCSSNRAQAISGTFWKRTHTLGPVAPVVPMKTEAAEWVGVPWVRTSPVAAPVGAQASRWAAGALWLGTVLVTPGTAPTSPQGQLMPDGCHDVVTGSQLCTCGRHLQFLLLSRLSLGSRHPGRTPLHSRDCSGLGDIRAQWLSSQKPQADALLAGPGCSLGLTPGVSLLWAVCLSLPLPRPG